jgi:hypothetical protein
MWCNSQIASGVQVPATQQWELLLLTTHLSLFSLSSSLVWTLPCHGRDIGSNPFGGILGFTDEESVCKGVIPNSYLILDKLEIGDSTSLLRRRSVKRLVGSNPTLSVLVRFP